MGKSTHGGIRENSGRKTKYGEETVLVGPFRVPKSKQQAVKDLVNKFLLKFQVKK